MLDVDIMKICMWVFDIARINFERVIAFQLQAIFCTVGYGVFVINLSYSFQWIVLKHCMLVVDIMKICIWIIDGPRINFESIMAFELSNFW